MTTYMSAADVFRPQEKNNALGYDIVLIIGGSLFVAACAQLSLQIGPVPLTGQTLGVLLVGALLGSKRGAAALIAYLMEGAAGLPFFAGGTGGAAVFAGPTGGYLVGFVFAAFVVGYLAERGWDRHVLSTAVAMIIGNAVIYLCGLPWLGWLLGWENMLAFGFLPFWMGDIVKIGIAMILLPGGWKLLGRE